MKISKEAVNESNHRDIHKYEKKLRRQITTWAFMKIFQGCRKLQHLDISYCSLVTDQEIRILAECCREMKELNLRECQQVGDVGLLCLKKCNNLLVIILARSGLSSRITDITLLSISEGCPMLQSLNLSGCEMITDVGISWLVNGCKDLRYVNLANCSKLTNGGMRYLGGRKDYITVRIR